MWMMFRRTKKPVKPTAAQIIKFREVHGCGMMEAKEFLTREYYIDVVKSASSIDDLREVLIHLLKKDCPDDFYK